MKFYRLTHYSSHPDCSGVPGNIKACPREIPQELVERWLPVKGCELVTEDDDDESEPTESDSAEPHAGGGGGDTKPARKSTGGRRTKAAAKK